MRKIPFHRRILPIIFIIAFLGFAPVIIFYTSGYRWNAKKGKVERYGTVIFDTTPTGARILVDNREIPNKTPITIQDMPPGTHRFELIRDGYSTWAKSLDVLPEKVTFVNNIWLWKTLPPAVFYPSSAEKALHSPDGTHILLATASPTQALILDTSNKSIKTLELGASKISFDQVRWSENGRYVVVGAERTADEPWLIDTYGQRAPLALTPADYRWSGSTLLGNDQKSIISIKGSDFSLTRTPLPQATRDVSDLAELRSASGTSNLVYVMLNRPDQGLILPPGDWIFESFEKDLAILKDGGRRLALAYKKDPPEYHTLTGKELQALTLKRQTTYLVVNGTEIWTWNGFDEPELILRQGEPLIDAVWHREGFNLFFATQKSVYALELDTRDRRLVTHLADFEQIRSFSAYAKRLFVLGTKDGQDGLWALDVE
jgi:hypothetical protein